MSGYILTLEYRNNSYKLHLRDNTGVHEEEPEDSKPVLAKHNGPLNEMDDALVKIQQLVKWNVIERLDLELCDDSLIDIENLLRLAPALNFVIFLILERDQLSRELIEEVAGAFWNLRQLSVPWAGLEADFDWKFLRSPVAQKLVNFDVWNFDDYIELKRPVEDEIWQYCFHKPQGTSETVYVAVEAVFTRTFMKRFLKVRTPQCLTCSVPGYSQTTIKLGNPWTCQALTYHASFAINLAF